ncbi:MAG: DUF3048 domain-containing protein [Candidatus Marinimicrobia bacterium]|nr:DUF3048 domain-containing protein [Candidatus Neomarinimicrobiota bacterium]
MMRDRKKLIYSILGGLLLYLLSTGVSFAAFRFLIGPGSPGLISPLPVEEARSRVDLTAPKTESCPLNGKMFTKGERQIWEKWRPLTVMIENHLDARPQSGLSDADVVYEAVAEGGITRFLAVFYCGAAAEEVLIGPVRSARTYYLDFASEYGDYPLYAHVGGANLPGQANALGQIGDYGWLAKGNDLNQFSLGFPTFWRDYERLGRPVATEHTMYSTTDKLFAVAHQRGLDAQDDQGKKWNENFRSWTFKDEGEKGSVEKISFNFWSNYGEYEVVWQYDRENNQYLRLNGGQAHKDLNNEEQLKAKVVIIQFMKEKGPIDQEKHLLYTTTGTGKALVFQDGQASPGTWEKTKRQDRTVFKDAQGKEIKLNKGSIWIEIIPAGKEVSY